MSGKLNALKGELGMKFHSWQRSYLLIFVTSRENVRNLNFVAPSTSAMLRRKATYSRIFGCHKLVLMRKNDSK